MTALDRLARAAPEGRHGAQCFGRRAGPHHRSDDNTTSMWVGRRPGGAGPSNATSSGRRSAYCLEIEVQRRRQPGVRQVPPTIETCSNAQDRDGGAGDPTPPCFRQTPRRCKEVGGDAKRPDGADRQLLDRVRCLRRWSRFTWRPTWRRAAAAGSSPLRRRSGTGPADAVLGRWSSSIYRRVATWLCRCPPRLSWGELS